MNFLPDENVHCSKNMNHHVILFYYYSLKEQISPRERLRTIYLKHIRLKIYVGVDYGSR